MQNATLLDCTTRNKHGGFVETKKGRSKDRPLSIRAPSLPPGASRIQYLTAVRASVGLEPHTINLALIIPAFTWEFNKKIMKPRV